MKPATIVTTSFICSMLLPFIGAYLKITHAANADTFLLIGVITVLIFIASAIYEVRTSAKISSAEKNLWTFAFIFFGSITGLVYFLAARKRIA